MHDIICPNCGDRFLASDVVFDLSEYIYPLLGNIEDIDEIKTVGFKYYIDEEAIINAREEGNTVPLEFDNIIGPGPHGPFFNCVVTSRMLFDYICETSKDSKSIINALSCPFEEAIKSPDKIECLKKLYSSFFTITPKSFDIEDANFRTAISILINIYNNLSENKNIVLQIRTFSNKTNGYHVPDVLFIYTGGNRPVILKKSCRCCGRQLPLEFGYYKIMPVVLLGSHHAGKTSFLVALYNAISSIPFTEERIRASTLRDDINLSGFDKNLSLCQQGKPPLKTEFVDIPILNIRINDKIYSFIDWPGEKFINNNRQIDHVFIQEQRRVIAHARHIMFFIEPVQVDNRFREGEELVEFPAWHLMQSLNEYISFTNSKRLRSVLFVLNKVDRLKELDQSSYIFDRLQQIPITEFFSGGEFRPNGFISVENEMKDYIGGIQPGLWAGYETVNTDEGKRHLKKAFLAVAPFGEDSMQRSDMMIRRGCLEGTPLLKVLEIDSDMVH